MFWTFSSNLVPLNCNKVTFCFIVTKEIGRFSTYWATFSPVNLVTLYLSEIEFHLKQSECKD